ncbi:hypothetical protein C2G38_2038659 [Gigaspora rosea]|uniref:Uncharacterized protein n=1 Tax=Gigaspora rosea TaxID=44941 RepID=A0A397V5Z3_9GLOM|nr:hypothetical protein C2G38_2038659 [Gigaspora rosea]
MSKQLSTWIRSGIVEENIKDTLDSTLNALCDVCPLKKSRESICDSLRDILYSDQVFRQSSPAHITIFGWLEDKKLSSSSSSSTQPKQSRQSKPFAIFKKTRFHSSAVGQHVTITHNYKDNRTVRDSSPSVSQSFSFTENEQGAVIEPFINLVEKVIYEFLITNESTIPLEIVENFCSKQRPLLTQISVTPIFCVC